MKTTNFLSNTVVSPLVRACPAKNHPNHQTDYLKVLPQYQPKSFPTRVRKQDASSMKNDGNSSYVIDVKTISLQKKPKANPSPAKRKHSSKRMRLRRVFEYFPVGRNGLMDTLICNHPHKPEHAKFAKSKICLTCLLTQCGLPNVHHQLISEGLSVDEFWEMLREDTIFSYLRKLFGTDSFAYGSLFSILEVMGLNESFSFKQVLTYINLFLSISVCTTVSQLVLILSAHVINNFYGQTSKMLKTFQQFIIDHINSKRELISEGRDDSFLNCQEGMALGNIQDRDALKQESSQHFEDSLSTVVDVFGHYTGSPFHRSLRTIISATLLLPIFGDLGTVLHLDKFDLFDKNIISNTKNPFFCEVLVAVHKIIKSGRDFVTGKKSWSEILRTDNVYASFFRDFSILKQFHLFITPGPATPTMMNRKEYYSLLESTIKKGNSMIATKGAFVASCRSLIVSQTSILQGYKATLSAEDEACSKIPAFVFVVIAPPGIGKSVVTDMAQRIIADGMGVVDFTPAMVVQHESNSAYDDMFRSSTAIINIDELGTETKSQLSNGKVPAVIDILSYADSNVKVANKSRVEEKGSVFIMPVGITGAGNFCDLQAGVHTRAPSAIYRRINMVELRVREEFRGYGGRPEKDKIAGRSDTRDIFEFRWLHLKTDLPHGIMPPISSHSIYFEGTIFGDWIQVEQWSKELHQLVVRHRRVEEERRSSTTDLNIQPLCQHKTWADLCSICKYKDTGRFWDQRRYPRDKDGDDDSDVYMEPGKERDDFLMTRYGEIGSYTKALIRAEFPDMTDEQYDASNAVLERDDNKREVQANLISEGSTEPTYMDVPYSVLGFALFCLVFASFMVFIEVLLGALVVLVFIICEFFPCIRRLKNTLCYRWFVSLSAWHASVRQNVAILSRRTNKIVSVFKPIRVESTKVHVYLFILAVFLAIIQWANINRLVSVVKHGFLRTGLNSEGATLSRTEPIVRSDMEQYVNAVANTSRLAPFRENKDFSKHWEVLKFDQGDKQNQPYEHLKNNVFSNILKIKVTNGASCYALGVCSQIMLINRHNLIMGSTFSLSRERGTDLHFTTMSTFSPSSIYNVNSDLALVFVSTLRCKQLTDKFLVSRLNLQTPNSCFVGELISTQRNFKPMPISFSDKSLTTITGNLIEFPINYNIDHSVGMCGLPVLSLIGNYNFIVGIHSAGYTDTLESHAISVTSDSIGKGVDFLLSGSAVCTIASQGSLPSILINGKKAKVDGPDRRSLIHWRGGNVNYLGSFPDLKYPRLKPKMCFLPTSDKLSEITSFENRLPSGLFKWGIPDFAEHADVTEESGYNSPWHNFAEKAFNSGMGFSSVLLEQVLLDYRSDYCNLARHQVEPLDVTSAMSGDNENWSIRGMNFASSMGFGFSGVKSDYCLPYHTDQAPDGKDFTPEVWGEIKNNITTYMKGECVNPINKASLKVEARIRQLNSLGYEKTKTPRVFNGTQVSDVFCGRMFLLPVCEIIKANRDIFGCCVGVNATSHEWGELRKPFEKYIKTCFGSDISGFDTRMPVQVKLIANTIILDLAREHGYNSNSLKILNGYLSDTLEPVIMIKNDVFTMPGLIVSGRACTAEYNSLCLSIIYRYLFYYLRPVNCSAKFSEHTSLIIYGDDSKCGTDLKWFNLVSFAEAGNKFGIKITAPDKSSKLSKFQHFDEIEFLHRMWRYDKEYQVWCAPLEFDSMARSLTLNGSSSIGPIMQAFEASHSINFELAQHGRHVHVSRTRELVRLLEEVAFPEPRYKCYDDIMLACYGIDIFN